MRKIKGIWLGIGALVLGLVLLSGCGQEAQAPIMEETGQGFLFEEKEMVIGDEISWVEVDGQDAFVVSVTLTNIADYSIHLMHFYWTVFDNMDDPVDCLNYQFEDSIAHQGYIYAGETVETTFVIPFTGNGTYTIDFGNWDGEIHEVRIQVER